MQCRAGLREMAYGEWDGKLQEYPTMSSTVTLIRWLADPGWNAPTGGEKG